MNAAPENRWPIVVGLACGLALGCLIGAMRGAELKIPVALAGAFLFAIALLLSRRAERLCLMAFIMAIPLPMHAFLSKLDPMHAGGALGIYAIAADLPLFFLYLCWFSDWTRGRSATFPRSSRYVFLLLPFLLFSALSIAWSAYPFWAACEWLRWFKVLLILVYAARRLRREDIPVCAGALLASASLESAIAVLQSFQHSNLGLDKLGVLGAGGEQAVSQQLDSGGLLFRGSALTGHPNFLATYLLLSLPMFAAIAWFQRGPAKKALWWGGFLLSVAGLASTMSRAAWVSFAIVAVLAFFAAVGQSLISPKDAAILVLSTLTLGGILTLSLWNLVRERFHADWDASWKLRVELNDAAIAMARDHVIGGVGLNNYTAAFPPYDPSMASLMMDLDNMLTVVHNSYLLVWAETGTVGLAAYLFFQGGAIVLGWRALRAMNRRDRALTLGILSGLLGAMMFDLTEISLWMEIAMYSVAFWIGALEPLSQPATIILVPRAAILQRDLQPV